MTAPDASAYYRGRWLEARYAGRCAACGAAIWPGATVFYTAARRRVECLPCGKGATGLRAQEGEC